MIRSHLFQSILYLWGAWLESKFEMQLKVSQSLAIVFTFALISPSLTVGCANCTRTKRDDGLDVGSIVMDAGAKVIGLFQSAGVENDFQAKTGETSTNKTCKVKR